jgi:hypothetical protein
MKVHMGFTFIPVICLLGIPLGMTAETACNLSMKELPKVEGMYLGMDEKEFKTLIPTAKRYYPNTNKVVEGVSDYEGYSKVGPFLYYYQSAFLNGKLVWLGLNFGDKSGVQNTDQAIRKFATYYGIPTEGWTLPSKYGGPSKELLCSNFSIWIIGPLPGRGGIAPAAVVIKDTEGSAIHQARRDKEAWWKTSSKAALAVEFETIRSNMKSMTSLAWDDYTKSLKGQRVSWTGWISDVKEQWLGGFKILIDMDPPGSASVQDVYIEDLPKNVAAQFRKEQKVRFSGKIKSVLSVLGSCAVTLEDGNISPLY